MSAGFLCIKIYFLNWVNFFLEARYLGHIRPRKTRSYLWDMWSNGFYFSAVLLYLAPCYTWGREGNMLAPRVTDTQKGRHGNLSPVLKPQKLRSLISWDFIHLQTSHPPQTPMASVRWSSEWSEMEEVGIYSAPLLPYWSGLPHRETIHSHLHIRCLAGAARGVTL